MLAVSSSHSSVNIACAAPLIEKGGVRNAIEPGGQSGSPIEAPQGLQRLVQLGRLHADLPAAAVDPVVGSRRWASVDHFDAGEAARYPVCLLSEKG